jgi:pSer/pThr/pTyr-binding forkhead associated (FHA) protein
VKARLIGQEGPGSGLSYPLDPSQQAVFSVGRSSQCDIVLQDPRASRHHSDFRWNGRQWEVTDRGSTNGTYVNRVQIYGPHELRVGDRVSIGETTMVLREHTASPTESPHPGEEPITAVEAYAIRQAAPAGRPPQPAAPGRLEGGQLTSAGAKVAFWLAQMLVVVAVIGLASGAFLPWFKVTGSLARDSAPLVQGISDIVTALTGEDLLSVTQEISGGTGFGKFTLGMAVLCAALLIVDIFVRRKSIVPSIVYLVISLAAGVVMLLDLKSLYDLYDQVQSMTLLFGIRLDDVVKAFGQFIDIEIMLLPGLYLTLAGLALLFVGGLVRLGSALLDRNK